MEESGYGQSGITEEQFASIRSRKQKVRNYTFGISSAAAILAGCIYGIYLSKGVYETVLFILFFGCFLGSILGGIFTIVVVALYALLMYIFSPSYRKSRRHIAAKTVSRSRW